MMLLKENGNEKYSEGNSLPYLSIIEEKLTLEIFSIIFFFSLLHMQPVCVTMHFSLC